MTKTKYKAMATKGTKMERVRLKKDRVRISSSGRGRPPGRKDTAPAGEKTKLSLWARMYTNDALTTLVQICKDEEAPHSSRISAANSILDRGYGKPSQSHELRTPDGPMMMKLNTEVLSGLPDEMLAVMKALIAALDKGDLSKITEQTNQVDASEYESTLH